MFILYLTKNPYFTKVTIIMYTITIINLKKKKYYYFYYTVESLLTDTPNKGHCIKYLSTMDTTKSPNFNPPINIMQLESLNRGQSL